MKEKYVYMFSEGNKDMRNILGGKGANLAEMTRLGLPVPQGFIVSTKVCEKYYNDGKVLSQDVIDEILCNLKKLEKLTNKKLGDKNKPLILSIRSGARVSMPGMMDSVLNLGLNDEVVEGLAKISENKKFAYDCYRRFIQMFANVVMGMDLSKFEKIIDEMKQERGIKLDIEFSADDLKEMIEKFKNLYSLELNAQFPQDIQYQLVESIKSVLKSWNNPRAIVYRKMNNIPSNWGTAVNVQMMVFGNMGKNCGTGVAFSRNPANGENELYGEYLMDAQGEDVVSGARTPKPIALLKEQNLEIYNEFYKYAKLLEEHYKDMQELEFTIENGKLYVLQTRNGKRTAYASLKIAVDLVEEGKISKDEALMMIDAKQLDSLLHSKFVDEELTSREVLTKGLPASPGAGAGKIAFSSEKAKKMHKDKQDVILIRMETSAEDIEGMLACMAILTARGGMTSHAAVVARGMGTACVVGCENLIVNEEEKYCIIDGEKFVEGDEISVDGSTGNVYKGIIKTELATISGYFATVMQWADERSVLKVLANADNAKDATVAYNFGAKGIGLCRTEHMFFQSDRIFAIRQMIVAPNSEERQKALEKILPMQKQDFEELFRVMKGYPVTIRFLDPPLHEFLPNTESEIVELAKEMNVSYELLKNAIDKLHEFNPMMGHRGLRLDVTYPEIAVMQTKAVIEASINVKNEGIEVNPEIMIPLTCETKEYNYVRDIVVKTANEIIEKSNIKLTYKVGTMIEIPRATLIADEIAKTAEFFSFGTNDLTQLTFGFSRDDAGKFLWAYYDKQLFENDPFAHIDEDGVGKLVQNAVKLSKQTRPDIKLGICGEHGGDPKSIDFFHRVGLTYVSCSPFRVPIARLAVAQANIRNRN